MKSFYGATSRSRPSSIYPPFPAVIVKSPALFSENDTLPGLDICKMYPADRNRFQDPFRKNSKVFQKILKIFPPLENRLFVIASGI